MILPLNMNACTSFVNCSLEVPLSKHMPKKPAIDIINFRGQPTFATENIDEEITKLCNKLQSLLYEESPDLSLEELYRSVENLVQFEQRETIFNVLNESNKAFLNDKLDELLLQDRSEKFFQYIISLWTYYNKKVIIIKNIYICYDRSAHNDFKFNTIQTVCMDLFKNTIILNPIVSNKITTQVLNEISNDRFGVAINKNVISAVLTILTDLGVYRKVFEKQFLIESKWYFQNEGRNIAENRMNIKDYLQHVVKRIEDEESRTYVLKESVGNVLAILYRYESKFLFCITGIL